MTDQYREVKKVTIILEDAEGNEWKLVADEFHHVDYSQFDRTEYGSWYDDPLRLPEQRRWDLGLEIKNCSHFTVYKPVPKLEMEMETDG